MGIRPALACISIPSRGDDVRGGAPAARRDRDQPGGGQVEPSRTSPRGAAKLLQPWCEQHSHDLPAAEVLGTAYWVRQDYRSAIDTLEAALREAPWREGLLRPLFLIYHEVENLLEPPRRWDER